VKEITDYEKLLIEFKAAKYKFIKFDSLVPEKNRVLLRHDIDCDVTLAVKMAEVEHALGVNSTYFIFIRSRSYNVLERKNAASIMKIKKLGHWISLHYDPSMYKDVSRGVVYELDLFTEIFGERPYVISFHSPPKDVVDLDLLECRHTYQPRYFTDIAYISDSRGRFSYGHPLKSQAFKEGKTLQLLIHPIWWMTGQESPGKALNWLAARRAVEMKDYFFEMNKMQT